MVSALVSATARVLLRWGYDRATTNRIAEVAGVSVGSVYQYFPNKDSLVAALIDSHVQRHMDILEGSLSVLDGPDLRSGVRAIVESMVHAHLLEPQLHSLLAEQVPKMGRMKRMDEIDREAVRLLLEKLVRHRRRLQPSNLELAAFLIVHSVEGVIHAIIRDPRAFDVRDVIGEVTSLVMNYLAPGAGGPDQEQEK